MVMQIFHLWLQHFTPVSYDATDEDMEDAFFRGCRFCAAVY